MSSVQLLVAFTRTGQVVDGLDVSDWSFDDSLAWADEGKLSISVPLPGRDRTSRIIRPTLRSIAAAGSGMSIAVVRDRTALWAGPVTSMPWNAEAVTIGCGRLGWILDRRIVLKNGWWGDPTNVAADLALELLPRDLAIELITQATTGTRRELPLTVPAQSGAQGDLVTYRGVDLKTAYEAIKETVEADGGPDIVFQPAISDDLSTLSWTAAVGDPTLGGPNPDAVWDFPLVAVEGDIDDSETVSTAYVLGDSSDSDTRYIGVSVRDRGEPWPALERADRTSVSERRQDRLDALAQSYGAEYAQAVEEITLSSPTDAGPQYRDQYNLGDIGRFSITGHPWLDDVEASRRVVAVNVTSDEAKLVTTGPRLTSGVLL